MGVGTPSDLVRAIGTGIDVFDCVLPTRNARNGQAFVATGRLSIRNARYREDRSPLDPDCRCPVCSTGYSRSYLRHLYLAGEILAHRLLSLHNLSFYAELVREAGIAIRRGEYREWAEKRLIRLGASTNPDPEEPSAPSEEGGLDAAAGDPNSGDSPLAD
jgi:queuine tRNA-ribosyltransferase